MFGIYSNHAAAFLTMSGARAELDKAQADFLAAASPRSPA